MSADAVFELLAAINPLPGLEVALPGDEAMLRSIVSTPVVPAERITRRRRGTTFGALGVSLVAVSMAAYAVLSDRSPDDPTIISCYSEASAAPAMRHALLMSVDPVADCAQVWRSGEFGPVDTVPQLVGCVNDDGIIAIVPGDVSTCERLSMQRWSMAFSDDEQRLIAFTDAIASEFAARCVTDDEAEPAALTLLADHGLDDWTVETVGHYLPDRPCSVVTIDPVAKTVFIGTRGERPGDSP